MEKLRFTCLSILSRISAILDMNPTSEGGGGGLNDYCVETLGSIDLKLKKTNNKGV